MFQGVFPALVTPFKDGKVDENAVRRIVRYHLERKTTGVVPCGCTGEAATLSEAERDRMLRIALEEMGGRKPVIAGTGTNSTETTIKLSKAAVKAGADGILLITPYYNKPTQRGLYKHYETVAAQVDVPVMLYNVPSRTGVSIAPETVAELSRIDNITTLKEAGGSVDRVSEILNLCDITVLSGDDSLTLPMVSVGAKGVVSVAANIVPDDITDMIQNYFRGEVEQARILHKKLFPLMQLLFIETNPGPVKKAMELMQMIEGEPRAPLVPVSGNSEQTIWEGLKNYGLIP